MRRGISAGLLTLLVWAMTASSFALSWVGNTTQYLDGRKERSTEALGRALRISEAPLITEQEKDVEQSDEVPRFKTNKERQDSALKVLGDLDKDYASTPAALRATLGRVILLLADVTEQGWRVTDEAFLLQ